MANDYAIQAVFRIIDGATAPLNAIANSSGLVGKGMQKAEKQMAAIGQTAKTAVKGAAVGAFAALTAGIAVATKQYIEFDQAVTASGALFKDLDPTAASFADSLEEIGAKAREVAAITEFNAVDTAGALSKMAMAGMDSKTAMALLAGTTDLATAAGTDLTTAVDIATDALGAFGMSSTAENLQRISDIMAKTASTSNTGLLDMFEAMKYAAPSFTAAGQEAETLAAAIGTLANAGIKGSQAGTALRAVFTQLGNGAKQAKLEELGVQVKDAAGNFLNLYDILAQLETVTATMGTAELTEVMNDIFGKTAGSSMLVLLQQGTAALKDYEQEMMNAGGSAAIMAGAMRSSIGNQIEVLKSGLTELGFKFVEAFKTQGSEALTSLTTFIQNLDVTNLVAGLVSVADTIGTIVSVIWKMKDAIEFAVIAWVAYKAAMLATVVVMQTVTAVKAALAIGAKVMAVATNWEAAAMIALTTASSACAAVQSTLNALFVASPIGWIVLGIMAVIAAVIVLIKNLDTVKAWVANAWSWLKDFGALIFSTILAPIESLLNALSYIPGIGKWASSGAASIAGLRESLTGDSQAPVSQGERMAYSKEESVSTTNLNIGLEKGLTGVWSGVAPGIDINMIASGAF